mgnify:CR=1 FL=1
MISNSACHTFLHTQRKFKMATSKLFTVIGVSTLAGKTKVRFANDLATRIKNLVKGGHTNIELFELPEAMTKDAREKYNVWTQYIHPTMIDDILEAQKGNEEDDFRYRVNSRGL